MKIDYSKWIFRIQDKTAISMSVENPSEGIILWAAMDLYSNPLTSDDPMKHLKEIAKKTIRAHYTQRQTEYLAGKNIPVEDNLDYIENEAERRGLL